MDIEYYASLDTYSVLVVNSILYILRKMKCFSVNVSNYLATKVHNVAVYRESQQKVYNKFSTCSIE